MLLNLFPVIVSSDIIAPVIEPVVPVSNTVPPASGKVITLSAVGSVTVIAVSKPSSVAPSNIINLPGAIVISELTAKLPEAAASVGVVKVLPAPKVKLSLTVIVFELFDVIVLPETLIEPRVASPDVIIAALMFITPPDTSSIVFVFTAAEPVVAIFPD